MSTLKQLAGLVVFIFLLWAVRVRTLESSLDAIGSRYAADLLTAALFYVCMVAPAFLFAKYVVRSNSIVEEFSLKAPTNPKFLLKVGVAAIAWYGILVVLLRPETPSIEDLAYDSVRVPWAAFAEELLFRGLLLSQLRRHFSFWRANLLQAVLFMGIHFYWLISQDWTLAQFAQSFGNVFVLGLIWGYVTYRSKSIWPSTALHWLNNLVNTAF